LNNPIYSKVRVLQAWSRTRRGVGRVRCRPKSGVPSPESIPSLQLAGGSTHQCAALLLGVQNQLVTDAAQSFITIKRITFHRGKTLPHNVTKDKSERNLDECRSRSWCVDRSSSSFIRSSFCSPFSPPPPTTLEPESESPVRRGTRQVHFISLSNVNKPRYPFIRIPRKWRSSPSAFWSLATIPSPALAPAREQSSQHSSSLFPLPRCADAGEQVGGGVDSIPEQASIFPVNCNRCGVRSKSLPHPYPRIVVRFHQWQHTLRGRNFDVASTISCTFATAPGPARRALCIHLKDVAGSWTLVRHPVRFGSYLQRVPWKVDGIENRCNDALKSRSYARPFCLLRFQDTLLFSEVIGSIRHCTVWLYLNNDTEMTTAEGNYCESVGSVKAKK